MSEHRPGSLASPAAPELAELARSVAREAADLLLARHSQAAVVQVKSSPTDEIGRAHV